MQGYLDIVRHSGLSRKLKIFYCFDAQVCSVCNIDVHTKDFDVESPSEGPKSRMGLSPISDAKLFYALEKSRVTAMTKQLLLVGSLLIKTTKSRQ